MKTVIISEGPEFKIESTGNGAFYTFTHKPTGKSVFFQGEDSGFFRDALTAAEDAFPQFSPDQIGWHLWCDCEYGSAAQHQPVEPWGPFSRIYPRVTFARFEQVGPVL